MRAILDRTQLMVSLGVGCLGLLLSPLSARAATHYAAASISRPLRVNNFPLRICCTPVRSRPVRRQFLQVAVTCPCLSLLRFFAHPVVQLDWPSAPCSALDDHCSGVWPLNFSTNEQPVSHFPSSTDSLWTTRTSSMCRLGWP